MKTNPKWPTGDLFLMRIRWVPVMHIFIRWTRCVYTACTWQNCISRSFCSLAQAYCCWTNSIYYSQTRWNFRYWNRQWVIKESHKCLCSMICTVKGVIEKANILKLWVMNRILGQVQGVRSPSISLQWRHKQHDSVANHQRRARFLSTVSSGAYQRIHQSSGSLAVVKGIHRWLVNSPHKGPVTRHRWIPLTKVGDAENVFIWWRHHEMR